MLVHKLIKNISNTTELNMVKLIRKVKQDKFFIKNKRIYKFQNID